MSNNWLTVQAFYGRIAWSCGCRSWTERVGNRGVWREVTCNRHGGAS